MNKFGELLHDYRLNCDDPDYPKRPLLSQARLGELLGKELGVRVGYSGAAVSDWERGKSKIHADERNVLVKLIKVLHRCGGITSLSEADELLQAGNYSALQPKEIQADLPGLQTPTSAVPESSNTTGGRDSKNAGERSVSELWPSGIPDEPYHPLPNREHSLNEMLAVLEDPQGLRMIAIHGLGGLGKTALASELARRAIQRGLFQGVIGETAKQEVLAVEEIVQLQGATLDYEGLLDALARQLQRWDMFALGIKEKQTHLSQILRRECYLILVDNLETAENAEALVAQLTGLLGQSRAILTSRLKVRSGSARSVSLEGLTLEDSLFFLHSEAQAQSAEQVIQATPEILAEIHQNTGGSPLAMKLVTAQAKFVDLDRILENLRQARGNLFPFIFRQSWDQLSVFAQSILVYIGKTAVGSVSFQELAQAGLVDHEETLLKAIDQLIAFSLLQAFYATTQIRYGIHQLTRQFINSDLPRMWREQGLL